MLTRRPLTLVLILCVCAACVSVVAALVCQNRDKCSAAFDVPIAVLSLAMCAVMLFTLFYVESMGHNTGMGMR